jgi:putative ABC transport system permease protein
MSALFLRLIIRPILRERVRTLLTVFAVALGVSVVLAIELAGSAAAGSFRSSMETLAGDNDFEVTAVGGVSESLIAQLATMPYPMRVSPRIEDHATEALSGKTIPVIGIDLVAEANARKQGILLPGANDAIRKINDLDAIYVPQSSGFGVGEKLRLLVNDQQRDYIVRGVLPNTEDNSGDEFVVMDIAAAQIATGKQGRVDRILVKVPEQSSFELWQKRLRAALPEGVQLNPQGSRTDANRRMLAGFRWNLRILSYVALVVGAFLIYNTISVSVVRRRHEIGIVRALGVSQRAVLFAVLGEAACFGIAGSLLAIPLGRVMAAGAVRLLGATIDALYVSSRPAALSLSPGIIALAIVVGIGVAAASALAPALEAASVPPTEAMARAQREYSARIHERRDLGIAVALGAAAALASRAPAIGDKPLFGYLAALLLIAASALTMPSLVHLLTRASSALLSKLLGVEAKLASRSLVGSLRRTAVLVGALSTAVAMTTSVGIMVGSFRQTVVAWMDSELPADLYVRPAGGVSADRHPLISVNLADRIERLPGVAGVDRFRAYEIEYEGLPASLGAADTHFARERDVSVFFSGRHGAEVLRELHERNNAIISEPFANKHHVRTGDTIRLPLGDERVSFRIIDIAYDYSSEHGYIAIDRSILLRYLPDPAVSNLSIYLQPGADLETARKAIAHAAVGSNVLIFSNRDIRTEAIRIFDQTFAITYALEAVAVFVAVMGIGGALLSIVIDRRREFGILRFLGAARAQIRKLILVEAGIIGLLSTIAGLTLGVLLSLILIFVINKQSFGWTIQFHWPVAVLLSALSVVYAATILAGLYPARIAQRLNPIEVVHEE